MGCFGALVLQKIQIFFYPQSVGPANTLYSTNHQKDVAIRSVLQ